MGSESELKGDGGFGIIRPTQGGEYHESKDDDGLMHVGSPVLRFNRIKIARRERRHSSRADVSIELLAWPANRAGRLALLET
jgi:hypothetical protein